MLAEERFSKILTIIEKDGGATVQQLMKELGTSESTIRRDLNTMDTKGLLTKVHGGAVLSKPVISTHDENVLHRKSQNAEEKALIGRYAASLIEPGDFVYIDAGTTTDRMIDYISDNRAVYVTNAISHARKLADKGCRVYILGGEFKSATEAIVGEEAVVTLDKYNFTKGFWGTNGITEENGFTTPEVKEAMVKRKSMEHCKERFVLADSSKFEKIAAIQFSKFNDATIITKELKQKDYEKCKNIVEVK